MTNIKKILVPVDIAGGARAALAMATALAKQFGASVELFHVWTPPPMLPMQLFVVPEAGGVPMAADDVAKSMANAQLTEIAAGLRKDGVKEVHCRVGVGDPARDIVDLAGSANFDLIVMGTHGRGGISHALLGSVAEKVVRRASCPVLTVRNKE
jgi:nucleotide-binding universal stress UspA family protein